ncbi:MAG: carbonic anhydrase [Gammaproteobacteria bacterium]|jgi:carbonic anhydrase|nr:carbonic anhydrase [Gammaproteobacteria bacterium]
MKKLINGIVDFRKNVRHTVKETFALLALGQRPDTLFIACSDSRVVPNLFASSDPGDLFVIRNVGNLIPPYSERESLSGYGSEAAAIEFALRTLPVSEVVVCGHSECGAIGALAHRHAHDAIPEDPAFKGWIRHGEGSLRQLNAGAQLGAHLERHNQLSQLNVLEQLEHLKTYPGVQDRLSQGNLRLHGWWFDIKEADVYEYEQSEGRFHLIDETYAVKLLNRDIDRP